MAQACEALGVPVVGGNVSLYNEAPSGPIFPTPVVGMVGRLPDPRRAGRLGFAADGDVIALVGALKPSLNGSELAKLRGEAPAGPLPAIDVQAIADAHRSVRDAVRTRALTSAHDIAEGGIAVALAECCIAGGIGAHVELPDGVDPFAEAPGRAFIVSYPADAAVGVGRVIGRVEGNRLVIGALVDLPVDELRGAWETGLS
jgi:phosphoribosylformylglycinamidine synthase